MKTIQRLGSPVFIIAVLLLVLNDWYLKENYPNALTGKLSDFAGLFAFPFLLSVLFPRRAMAMYSGTFLLFIVWKSPLVQPVIDVLRHIRLPVQRTVDYTDYVALAILPFSYYEFKRPVNYILKPVLVNFIAVFSALAFIATSMPPGETVNYTDINKMYTFKFSKRELVSRLNLLQLEYVNDMEKWGSAKVDFDSKANIFYYKDPKDTVAMLIDYEKVRDTDTVFFRTMYAGANVTGNDTSSNLKLVRLRGYVLRAGKGDYKTKAIKFFEKIVVRRIKNYK